MPDSGATAIHRSKKVATGHKWNSSFSASLANEANERREVVLANGILQQSVLFTLTPTGFQALFFTRGMQKFGRIRKC